MLGITDLDNLLHLGTMGGETPMHAPNIAQKGNTIDCLIITQYSGINVQLLNKSFTVASFRHAGILPFCTLSTWPVAL